MKPVFEENIMRSKISFIGVGNMATAILNGITTRPLSPMPWSDIILFDNNEEKMQRYAANGAHIAKNLREAIELSDCVILCVKPQNFSEVLPAFSDIPNVENKLIISIAAGISTETIAREVKKAPIVRVMPNTPMLISQGVSALCRTQAVSDEDFDFACNIFASAGKIIKISEDEMNKIICVTGSSPAYVFMVIKAMLDAAANQGLLKADEFDSGLDQKELLDAICDTVIGSAMLVKASDKSLTEQIQTVCSKGGTTEKAVAELEKYKLYEAFDSAMVKCTKRAYELGNEKK